MRTRKRALIEANADYSRGAKLAKTSNRDQESASVPPDSGEQNTEAPVIEARVIEARVTDGPASEVSTIQLKYLTIYSTSINSLMAKRQYPADELAIGLWVRLSAFAHWTHSEGLQPWSMMDDGERWQDTVALIGIVILATVNALNRANLLMEHSPINDLGLVLAILGDFICDCVDLSLNTREDCWPYKIVSYAKASGIEIKGVYGIEDNFVQRFDNADEANRWKRKECVDRWGWGTKWTIFGKKYAMPRSIFNRGPQIGGNAFDIISWPADERRKYQFEDKDPLDPQNPEVRFE
ncbi:hypothetical protein TW65_00210 [Stemphylium lycopersici]|nr:hypothetical protein TW65_00210 [Stemphylium lycopersici]